MTRTQWPWLKNEEMFYDEWTFYVYPAKYGTTHVKLGNAWHRVVRERWGPGVATYHQNAVDPDETVLGIKFDKLSPAQRKQIDEHRQARQRETPRTNASITWREMRARLMAKVEGWKK